MEIKELEGKIINADCMDILKQLPDKCVDLVLTDPPYNASNSSITCADRHYSTINAEWDKNFNPIPYLNECKRILKNGGSMLFFLYLSFIRYLFELEWIKITTNYPLATY